MFRTSAVALLAFALVSIAVRAADFTSGPKAEVPQIVVEFLDCLSVGDLDCLMATYGENPALQTRGGLIEGHEAIRDFLEPVAAQFREPGASLRWRTEIVEGDFVMLAWTGTTQQRYYEMLNQRFVVAEEKIESHNFELGYLKYPNLGSRPELIADLDGTALFFAEDSLHGKELWRSDGTPEGTALVKDLAPGLNSPEATGWLALGDRLYFCFCHDPSGYGKNCTEGSGLWATDGTAEGTVQVKHVRSTCTVGTTAAALDGVFVFVGEDARHGAELWRSDGTPDGTRLVKDIRPGPEDGEVYEPFRAGKYVYFGANDGGGTQLWRTDGTAKGTVPLAELRAGYNGSHWAFSEFEGDLLFTGDDGKRGGELWRSDGTPKGTRLVKDLRRGAKGSKLFEITELDGIGYFSATDGKEREVFRTDGTTRGTFGINANPRGSSYPDHMAISRDRILLYASDKQWGGELWAIEPGGLAAMVRDIYPGAKGSHPNLIVDLDGTALFAAEDPVHGMELWRTDGTWDGTRMVKDLEPGPDSGRPREMTRVGDFVFFNADDGTHGTELWRTDGTEEGTIRLGDLNPRPEEYRRPETP